MGCVISTSRCMSVLHINFQALKVTNISHRPARRTACTRCRLRTCWYCLLAGSIQQSQMSSLASQQERERCGRCRRLERQITSLPPGQQQRQCANPLGLTRVVRHVLSKKHTLIDRDLPASLFQLVTPIQRDRCRRSPSTVATSSVLRVVKWALPVRESSSSQEYGNPGEVGRGGEICTSVRVYTGLRLLSSTRRWVQTGDSTLLCYFYMREVYGSSTSFVIHAPLGACRGFDAAGLLLHAGSVMGSRTSPVIHAPLEYVREA